MYQVKYIGDPVLREISQNIETFDNKFQKFIEEMTEIMYREDGIGLAAPQIGITQNVVIIDISELEENESLRIFVNPVILMTDVGVIFWVLNLKADPAGSHLKTQMKVRTKGKGVFSL